MQLNIKDVLYKIELSIPLQEQGTLKKLVKHVAFKRKVLKKIVMEIQYSSSSSFHYTQNINYVTRGTEKK